MTCSWRSKGSVASISPSLQNRPPSSVVSANRRGSGAVRARFGRGEDTLTDTTVRNTWEIPTSLVRIEWSDAFGTLLEAARDELGLASSCKLTADLHSMLVYEPGQFFVAHQDSEKDDAMIGTLVVTLPSTYTGGELVLDDGGKTKTYPGRTPRSHSSRSTRTADTKFSQ